ncbi:MAG: hypothetical protein JWN04_3651, partial [Myxococcaceae bacterium]|nr:hypothetical protein [Myxococcaceae bacterium]
RSTEAELVIDESVEGRLFVWDEARKLSVEVDKLAGRRVALALPPGTYRVELSRGAHFLVAEVRALAGQPASLGKAAFKDSERESTLARGVVDQFALHPFAASVIAPFSTNHVVRHAQRRPVLNHIGVAALYDDPDALEGFQLGLFGLGARRYAKGLQLAAVFTDAGELQGAQLSFVANVTRSFASGLQLSSLVNYTGERLRGIQAAAGINYTALAHGAQLGLGINVAREELTGTQVGGLNWARTGRGMQAGLVNLAREVHGLQLGAVNVAAGGVRGAQLGLINYADEADFSLALLGITRQGGAHVQLAFDELLAPAFALQLHAKYNYSFVQAALAPFGDERRGYTLGAGLGFKAPTRLSKLWVDSEFGFHMVQPLHDFKRHLPNSLYRIRVLARYELQPHFSVFAGLTLNVYLQLEEADRFLPRALVMMHEATRASSTGQVYYWPGFVFGVRL